MQLLARLSLVVSLGLIHPLPGQSQDVSGTSPTSIPDLITFWDFQPTDSGDHLSKGAAAYVLTEMNGPIQRTNDGIFGPSALQIQRGQWLRIKRDDCPALNRKGKDEVTVVAWIKRQSDNNWQYIAGMWNERDAKRQYALFSCGHKQTDYTTLNRIDAKNQPHGYVSDVGGATPHRPYCFSYATGKTTLNKDNWYMIAYTYDHKAISVYTDGKLDQNGNYNPFYWDKPIFDGGDEGSDFTVAQRALPAWPGYPEVEEPTHHEGFGGIMGGLAVYGRALSATEMQSLYESTLGNKQNQISPSS
ncbi:Concanavalin A-like lectin/glucanases superfamily protein [Neorhodopirellula lusitana]|uniref:Concanavalin A-like lectin/glucanases superfamily protein n=1 Tax=Neorhodopirellula lusitana TaxID=445327 RepID=A0ABY1QG60_9BACT|nr:LamG-like jellyroll fold domain-containing protein [Neorhodopirellula lusitana]SMP68909.1 Concanavalin A-like lectin/glucanases superfamily protein [Neorhodopirellula lusitana]